MRWIRRICLLCFCVLVLAFAVWVFILVAPPNITGCGVENIIPHYVCSGPLAGPKALILNLPIFFIYAPLFTIGQLLANSSAPERDFFLLLAFLFDLVLVLGLAWPALALAERRRAKRDLPSVRPRGR